MMTDLFAMNPKTGLWEKVTGIKPWSNKQLLKIYWLIGLWLIFFLYLIIRQAICGCLYLIAGQGILIMMMFLVSIISTRRWYKKQEVINFIFK